MVCIIVIVDDELFHHRDVSFLPLPTPLPDDMKPGTTSVDRGRMVSTLIRMACLSFLLLIQHHYGEWLCHNNYYMTCSNIKGPLSEFSGILSF